MPNEKAYTITMPTTGMIVHSKGGALSNGGAIGTPIPVISTIPIQVAGLVPMTPCCNDAVVDSTGNYHYTDFDAGTSNINLKINGTDYGTYVADYHDSNAQIKVKIDALFVGIGIVIAVTGSGFNRIVTLTAPVGTGSLWNGYVILPTITAGSASITSVSNFANGSDFGSAPGCDCRKTIGACCESLIVFGDIKNSIKPPIASQPVQQSTYENDFNDFLFDIQLKGMGATWTIEKCSSTGWSTIVTTNNNVYGVYNALNTIADHLTYTGFTVNWGAIYHAFGYGSYRIKLTYSSAGTFYSGCFASPCFNLRKFNCKIADGTIKFEIINASTIGSCDNSGYVFNMCNMNWHSSVRHKGMFGENTVPKYNTEFNKWQNGIIEQVHDEALPKWKFKSKLLTKPYHDRLKIYMMMAQKKFVSDYNILNVDHAIKQMSIEKIGTYEPTDFNTALPPVSMVTVEFNSGIQNLFASNCCNLR